MVAGRGPQTAQCDSCPAQREFVQLASTSGASHLPNQPSKFSLVIHQTNPPGCGEGGPRPAQQRLQRVLRKA